MKRDHESKLRKWEIGTSDGRTFIIYAPDKRAAKSMWRMFDPDTDVAGLWEVKE